MKPTDSIAPSSTLTVEEKARRKAAVDFARGSVRFEGVILSEKMEALNQSFIEGRLTSEEHSVQCIELLKSKDLPLSGIGKKV